MTKAEIVQALESIMGHIEEMSGALDQADDQARAAQTAMLGYINKVTGIATSGYKVRGRIPELTQHPVGDMIARDLLPENSPPRRQHDLLAIIRFRIMSLEVELPNLLAGLEE